MTEAAIPKQPPRPEDFIDLRQPDARFHDTIGQLVLAWARLEGGLAHLLNVVIEGGESWRGRDLYYSENNISPRLALIDAQVTELIARDASALEIRPRWRKLKKAIEAEAKARRNKIVHSELVGFTNMSTLVRGSRLVPYFGAFGRRPDPAEFKGTFDVPDIEDAKAAADRLWEATQALMQIFCARGHPTAQMPFAERFDTVFAEARSSIARWNALNVGT